MMKLATIVDTLRRRVEKAGGVAAWSRENGISASYVSDVLNQDRRPGEMILDILGFERAMVYRRKRKKTP